jgi:hypothetical protein
LQKHSANCSAFSQTERSAACQRRLNNSMNQEPAAGLHAWVYFVDDDEPGFFSVPLPEMIAGFDHRRYRDAIAKASNL